MIPLLNDIGIRRVDDYNWALVETKEGKTLSGEVREYEKHLGFYPNFSAGFMTFCQKYLGEEDAQSFEEIISRLEDLEKLAEGIDKTVK